MESNIDKSQQLAYYYYIVGLLSLL